MKMIVAVVLLSYGLVHVNKLELEKADFPHHDSTQQTEGLDSLKHVR
jgi:hypothetical protein